VVAVSGGPDSVCLLHLFKELPSPYALSLHVAHLNHGLRPEAVEEADFIAKLSKILDLPCTSEERSVVRHCKKTGMSKQAGARAVRYQFLKEVAQREEADWIALGHHADDQAETFLMRMLRGAGMEGLSGIPEVRDALIIRPLLSCSRKEIMEKLLKEKIPYIEDVSNGQLIYRRNQVRHQLMPILETYNPRIKETLCKEAILLRDENHFIHQTMIEALKTLDIEENEGSFSMDVSGLIRMHPALQRRVLRWMIKKLPGDMTEVGFNHIERIRSKILQPPVGGRLTFPSAISIEKKDSRLWIKRNQSRENCSQARFTNKSLSLLQINPGMTRTLIHLRDWGLEFDVSLQKGPSYGFLSTCIAYFDFDKISLPLQVRRWEPGDRFVPMGMKGHHKKLQDYFVDKKITKENRHYIPILFCKSGILWVMGYRTDERFSVHKRTARTLIVHFKNTQSRQQKNG
ncbi:MAG: tRNA lysidine(34) synthetase TilS, partial [Nitrospiria bacterium]